MTWRTVGAALLTAWGVIATYVGSVFMVWVIAKTIGDALGR